jgi:transcriptional regulator of acetoin/glycerol metabolism
MRYVVYRNVTLIHPDFYAKHKNMETFMSGDGNVKLVRSPWNDDSQKIGADYYEKKLKRTLEEWNHFINGETKIDISVIPGEILESWQRCQSLGVNPINPPKPPVLTEGEIKELLQKNKPLIDASEMFVNHLYHFVRSSRFTVSLYDKDGYVLNVLQDKKYEPLSASYHWMVGAKWTEDIAGNNAAGTTLFYKRPTRIFATQHYCRPYHNHTTSSAPIFSPDGELIGGIVVIGFIYGAHPHTLGMVVAAAHAVENELKIQRALAQADKTNKDQKTVISSIHEAIITVDADGYVSFMNENAKKMLHITAPRIEGELLSNILGATNFRLLEIIRQPETVVDREVRIHTKSGVSDYTLTTNSIVSQDGTESGKILFINEIKRAKTLVTKMIGAKAKFHFEDIYGQNPGFLKTIAQARMIAQSNSNVLLLGKSGTGKDIFAQAIHNAGERRDGPYVAINCAAIPRDLIASELFGYMEGAFTGSRKGGNQGKFELADGGTIFLDEIAETPLELQSALLRVIEEKSVMRVGDTRMRPVNVRIIAATNRNLRDEIAKGAFREDLYYRLNVFSIALMPLSERQDDIPLLVREFVKKYEATLCKQIDRISNEVFEAFIHYPWPGNVRELQNIVERMMNMAPGRELTLDLVPREILDCQKESMPATAMRNPIESERDVIAAMLKSRMQKKDIAEKLGMSRMTLYRKMEKYGLH